MHHHNVNTVWVEGLAFDSQIGMHTVRIDGHPIAEEKSGTGPKALILTSLTGCSAMDVVSILEKMQMPFDHFSIEANAPLTSEHPKVYQEIQLIFRFKGKQLDETKIRRAITLSMEKYCGVATMLRAHCPILWEVEMEETA
ncbi:MAG: OsmC family protein [Lewinellaceae bacterium]|nr:OsmC family protein [Lewinellaceae bacterium]